MAQFVPYCHSMLQNILTSGNNGIRIYIKSQIKGAEYAQI